VLATGDLRLICDNDEDFAKSHRAIGARRRQDRHGRRGLRHRQRRARIRCDCAVIVTLREVPGVTV